jgi:hypothetical protein
MVYEQLIYGSTFFYIRIKSSTIRSSVEYGVHSCTNVVLTFVDIFQFVNS